MKKIVSYVILLFLFILINNICFAEGFVIQNYKVNIKVNKDKTVDIKEDIDVYFEIASHWIYRTIPLKQNEAVANISVNNKHQIIRNFDIYKIKIGNPDNYVNGRQFYSISYIHKLNGPDNEFYYNIIGTEWDAKIEKVSFNIDMPEKFEPSKVGLSVGKYGTKCFEKGLFFM